MVLEYSAFSIKSNWGKFLNYAKGVRPEEHFAQFYESEDALCEMVVKFVIEGLAKVEGVVVLATQDHINKFEQRLQAQAIDIEKVLSRGQLLLLDADKLLNQFIIAGQPDANRFKSLMGNLLEKMSLRYIKIRAFGEMVNILCEKQNFTGAICLEHLWNELANKYYFALLCGYKLANFKHDMNQMPFQQICHMHSRIMSSMSPCFYESADKITKTLL